MKKNIGLVLLIIIMSATAAFLIYTIISKQNITTNEFNLKRGDELTFENYNTKVKVLNVASTLCKKEKCDLKGEVEVSLEVNYNDNISTYTLKSTSDNKKRIKNSNNYIIFTYKDKKLNIEVKDKNEI